ncbi:TIGR01906 family membrane protein [Arthrobacter sp. 2YAF22_2]|uniref:TIGR01906 family membrane protein n=1 Tax=Arthrobacter sp. 2YAF22_2 TaxID=3233029 RepID=UPI003F917118
MTETSPTPPNRPDPLVEPAEDADEPAFEWMKPAAGKRAGTASEDSAHTDTTAAPAAGAGTPPGPGTTPDAGTTPGAGTADAATPAAAQGSTPVEAGERAATPGTRERQGRRAERTASPASGPDTAAGTAGDEGVHRNEALPTSALQLRPPREEVERRNAERESAANAKPVAPRVMQVLLAVCFPIILLVLAVRAVASPLFLWVEYNRPGFPGDGYGFNADDRMTYGSYAVDYLSNWSGPRYLGDLVNRGGETLFKDGEVSHMADVKLVILSTFGAGVLLVLLSLVAILYLRRRSPGGVRRGLFAGSIATLVIIIGLGVLAVLGWEQFFTEFHRIFFANGTWTFSLQDTLIRLFPGQFWVDAGITIGGLVLLAAILTLILTWPTRKRRGLPPRRAAAAAQDGAAQEADAGMVDPAALKGRRFKRRNGAAAEHEPAPGHESAAGPGAASSGDKPADRAGAAQEL